MNSKGKVVSGWRVRLSPDLEAEAGEMKEAERLQLAARLRNWARQLEISVRIRRADAVPRPPVRIRRLPEGKLRRN